MADTLPSPVKTGLEDQPGQADTWQAQGDLPAALPITLDEMIEATAEDTKTPSATLEELEDMTAQEEAALGLGGPVRSPEERAARQARIKRAQEKGLFGKIGKLRLVREAIGRRAVGKVVAKAFGRISEPEMHDTRDGRMYARAYRNIRGKIVTPQKLHAAPHTELKEAPGLELSRQFALAVGSPAAFNITDAHLLDPSVTKAAFDLLHKRGNEISPAEVGGYLRVLDDVLQRRKDFLGDIIYDPKDDDAISMLNRASTLIDEVHAARREYDVLTLSKRQRKYVAERQPARQSLLEYLESTDRATTHPDIVVVPPALPQRVIRPAAQKPATVRPVRKASQPAGYDSSVAASGADQSRIGGRESLWQRRAAKDDGLESPLAETAAAALLDPPVPAVRRARPRLVPVVAAAPAPAPETSPSVPFRVISVERRDRPADQSRIGGREFDPSLYRSRRSGRRRDAEHVPEDERISA